jgi:flagellar basal-body rod protein FlgF
MTEGEVKGANMDPGTITPTGRPLDVALQGSALLAVQAQDGSEAYTRRGDLAISPTGVLKTATGAPWWAMAGRSPCRDAKVAIGPMVRCW